jgi:hypothetical protein
VVDGVVHYCVANMPGAVPRTSTFALGNATRPFVLALADKGFPRALIDDVHLQNGLNVHDGKVTCRAVADALRLPYTAAAEVLDDDQSADALSTLMHVKTRTVILPEMCRRIRSITWTSPLER